MMDALAGHDPGDPGSVATEPPVVRPAIGRPARGLRIGIARAWHASADPDLVAAIDAAAAALAADGAIVEDVAMPSIADFHAVGRLIILAEGFSIHQKHLRENPTIYGAQFRDRMRLGAFISADEYHRAIRFRRTLCAAADEAMAPYDVVLTATHYGPPDRMEDAPTFPFFGRPYLTMPFNVTGQPAAAVPCGFYNNGLPMSLQVAGAHFADDTVLAVAHLIEQAIGERSRRPAI